MRRGIFPWNLHLLHVKSMKRRQSSVSQTVLTLDQNHEGMASVARNLVIVQSMGTVSSAVRRFFDILRNPFTTLLFFWELNHKSDNVGGSQSHVG